MNLYAAIFAAVVAAAMLAGSYLQGRKDGANTIRADYAARDIKASQEYASKEREITEAYRKKESQLAQSFAAVGTNLQAERVKHAATKKDLDAALAAGALVLRDPGTTNQTCGGQAAPNATSASGNNDHAGSQLQSETTGVLSREASTFLINITDEADILVTQLSACQQLLIDERK